MPDSLDLGEVASPPVTAAYRVLARKYRPQTFAALIGQDAMVTTLANAIRRDRLAHAFLLTGVRGVGKTSTARLIAKALNCVGIDGSGGPTIEPCGRCEFCTAITEGRHIDVIEMDAASHTGVDDMRAVIDASRMTAFTARFKIYIIDEVHMLSKSAFNALLKTLEEPAEGVKFLLATTEVSKVPVTVLSRCQRFDLRRIGSDKLVDHFAYVAESEGVEADRDALALIARASEGSARDGLSILDQAIAHAGAEGGRVTAHAVRDMLGLSERGAIRDLLGSILAGEATVALASLRRQYDLGVDPLSVLRALLESVHATTLVKLGSAAPAVAVEEQDALTSRATSMSFAVLHRLWQMLLKGHDEVARAVLPIEACEMAVLRLIHASTLPDPAELAQLLSGPAVGVALPAAPPQPAEAQPSAGLSLPTSLDQVVDLLDQRGEHALSAQLVNGARLVRFEPPDLVLSSARPVSADLVRELAEHLKSITGRTWRVTTDPGEGEATIRERRDAARSAERAAVLQTPVVRAAFEAFPEAELESWTSEPDPARTIDHRRLAT